MAIWWIMEIIRADKPSYHQLEVSPALRIFFDTDDTWIAIQDPEEGDCVMVGLNEIDSLILQLQRAKEMLEFKR